MSKIYTPLLFALLLTYVHKAIAQTTADTITVKNLPDKDTVSKDELRKISSFKIGIDYLSNNVFLGRTTLSTTPVISPDVKYTFKSGVFISGALNYLPKNTIQKLDGGNVSAGVDLDLTDNLSSELSFTKLLYSANSTQIGASVSSTFNGNLTYDIGNVITPSISANYSINKQGIKNDIILSFALTHDFIIENAFAEKDLILISPSITANAGTQNFYDAYLTRRVFKNAKRTAAQNLLVTEFEKKVNQLKLLDYELSLPVEYKAGHFIFQFTPTYAIVENQIKSQAVAKALGIVRNTSVFYFNAGVTYTF